MSLVRNFSSLSGQSQEIRLTWDRPLDVNYNQLLDINITNIVSSNQIQIASPINVEIGFLVLQGSFRKKITARGVGLTTLTLDSTSGLTTTSAKLQVTTEIVIQRKKDAYPVQLSTGSIYTENTSVEVFRGSEVIGSGLSSKDINNNNILTDSNANFSSNLVGRILRDSSSFNFLIEAVVSSTQLQLQSNDTLHNGVYVILPDFPQNNTNQIQPVDFTQITSSAGIITDINGFLVDSKNNIYAKDHELANRIVIDSIGNQYIILDNTPTQLYINNTSISPTLNTFPGYTILKSFNGVNTEFFYTDNFINYSQANSRQGTGLEEDTWYYYTAFTKNISVSPANEDFATFDNVNSTQSFALSTGNRDFGLKLYNYFPELYRLTDSKTDASGQPATSGTGNLEDLMSIFGIEFNELFSLVETFKLQDADKVSSAVLDQFAYQLGIPPTDSSIGRDTLRRIATDLIGVFKNKGNKIGICNFIRIITTWDITNGTGDFDSPISDDLPNVDALRFYSSALGILNTRFYGTRSIVSLFTPLSYDSATGIVNINKAIDISSVQINDYFEVNNSLYRILGGINSTPISDGNILFNNSSSTSFTYNSVTGIVQYSASVDLSLVNIGDLFVDGSGLLFSILAVNDGSDNLTIEPGQVINITPAPGVGGSVQEGVKQFALNTGLTFPIAPSTVIRVNPNINIVPLFTPSNYTSVTGVITVSDSVDLSNVLVGDIFTDASNNTFSIIGGIDNTTGNKQFAIATEQIVSLASGATINRIAQEAVGKFLKQLPGIIIPGFFTFREFVINLPNIAMFEETIAGMTVNNGQATITFSGLVNFGQDNGLVGCYFYPNQSVVKEAFKIISNSSNSITLNGVPQFVQIGDTSVILTPLNSSRFQRLNDLISLVSPYNTKPGFNFITPIGVPI